MTDDRKLNGIVVFVRGLPEGVPPWEQNEADRTVDITEGVQVLYDLAVASDGFGSGFWTAEDAAPVAKLGKLLGFEGWEDVQAYADRKIQAVEVQKFLDEIKPKGHKHYFAGESPLFPERRQCQWPECHVKEGSPEHIATLDREDEYRRKLTGKIPHDHVFGSIGRCLWPNCKVREEEDA